MAFVTISTDEIEVGDPLKKDLFDKIKNSLDDLDSRATSLENQNAKVVVFNQLITNAASFSTATGLAYVPVLFDYNLIGAELRIFEKGSLTGFLEIDIQKSTGNLDSTDFGTVFTTKPKITFASVSDYGRSTNQVFDTNQIALETGDTLRLDITQMPSGGVLGKFLLTLYGEV